MADPKTVSTWHQAISSLLRTPPPPESLENTPRHQLETDFDRKTNCGEKPILFLINPKSGSGRALNVFNSQVREKGKDNGNEDEVILRSVHWDNWNEDRVCTHYLRYLRNEIWEKRDNTRTWGHLRVCSTQIMSTNTVHSLSAFWRIVLVLYFKNARDQCWRVLRDVFHMCFTHRFVCQLKLHIEQQSYVRVSPKQARW